MRPTLLLLLLAACPEPDGDGNPTTAAVTLPTCDPAVGTWADATWTLSKRYWSGYADAVREECDDMALGVLQHDDGRCVYVSQLCQTPEWPGNDPEFTRDEGEPALDPCEPTCTF